MMRARGGFTLIEVVLVTLIIAVIAALAVPDFSHGYGRMRLRRAADDLGLKARWAQAMAMGRRRTYVLAFAPDLRSYRLLRLGSKSAGAPPPVEAVPGPQGRTQELLTGVALETSAESVKFYPDGTIDPVVIKLSAGNERKTLSSAGQLGMLKETDEQ